MPKPGEDLTSGPVEFKSRYHGQKGHVYTTTKATTPCVAFSTDSTIEKISTVEREDLHPFGVFRLGILRNSRRWVGVYGWKANLVVGWALDSEVADIRSQRE